jgi:hypothetical protein
MPWLIFGFVALVVWQVVFFWPDFDVATRSEARVFLNAQTDFETYILGDEALCNRTKYEEIWGIQFTGIRADGTEFQAVVCPSNTLKMGGIPIPNQEWDPLDVAPNVERPIWPREVFYIAKING